MVSKKLSLKTSTYRLGILFLLQSSKQPLQQAATRGFLNSIRLGHELGKVLLFSMFLLLQMTTKWPTKWAVLKEMTEKVVCMLSTMSESVGGG